MGISEDDLGKIWGVFYCVDHSRSRKSGGVGLGLSIVKAIAERLDWKICAESRLGEGSKFTVSLKNNFQEDWVECSDRTYRKTQ